MNIQAHNPTNHDNYRHCNGLTRGQVRWAQEHDWFVSWHMREGLLYVLVSSPVSNLVTGESWLDTREFSDWQELRAWAGY